MEQILSLWPGHGYGPMLPQQSFLSVLILLFSMAKIGGNTQVCCSERRAGREKLFRGTLAFLELCPMVRRGTANCLFKLQRDRQWRDAPVSSPRPAGSRERQGPIQHLAVSCQLQDFPTLQLAPAHNFLRTFTSYISVSWASTSRSFLSGEKEDEIQNLILESNLVSCEEGAQRDQPNQDLVPSMWPNSETLLSWVCKGYPVIPLSELHFSTQRVLWGCQGNQPWAAIDWRNYTKPLPTPVLIFKQMIEFLEMITTEWIILLQFIRKD